MFLKSMAKMIVGGWFFELFILGRIFWGGNCYEVYKWGETFNDTVLQLACSLECSDEPCITNCTRTKEIKVLDEEARADVRLICRDQSYVVLAHNPGLFVIKMSFKYNNPIYDKIYRAVVSNATQVVVSNLLAQEFVQIYIHRIFTNGISIPEESMWDTLPGTIGYRPRDVTNIRIGELRYESVQRSGSWTVEISFTPSEDRPCYYDVKCQQDDGEYNEMFRLTNEEEFTVTLRRLPFAANFTVTIKSLTDNLRWDNSDDIRGAIATFSTPRCQYPLGEVHCFRGTEESPCSFDYLEQSIEYTADRDYYFMCMRGIPPPKAVTGLNATAIHKTGNIFDVNLRWDAVPINDIDPFEYFIEIHPIGGLTENRVSRVIAGGPNPTKFVFPNVTILDQYDVYIRAKNWIGEGPRISRRFTTGVKRSIVPVAVEGLNATVDPKVGNTFDIRVSWDRPEMIPDFYIVNVTSNSSQTNYPLFRIIDGAANETVFTNAEISEEFDVYVRAWSSAGGGPEILRRFIKPHTSNDQINTPENNHKAIYLASTISIIVIGIGIAVYGYFRLRRRQPNQTVPVDELEINPERLTITQVLGTGNFGVVKLASLRDNLGNVINVAVKMLQDDSNKNDRRNFLREIEIMKTIDEHPNILCLLGCCTTGPYPFLVVEYCSRGDLQSFLRKSLVEGNTTSEAATKKPITHNIRSPRRKEILPANSRSLSEFRSGDDYIQVTNSPEIQDPNSEPEVVTVMDMLNFGRQIATGMEFLSLSKIVHRDLATRNVLVCHDRTVKISDFGLSRDIYHQNVYKKWGNGQMPLKWMAIEALTHQIYTTCSDVWSFGVLLWEIVTLGGEPYPGVPTLQILRQLQSGYRMERPANCSMPLYKVMRSCWQTRPKDRPTFTVLRQELDKLICAATKNEYFDLNDVSEGTPSQVDDSQIFVSGPSSCHLHVAIVNNLEPLINTKEPEGKMDELEMD